MDPRRIDRIRRLVRVTRLIYRQQAAEVVALRVEHEEKQMAATDSAKRLESQDVPTPFAQMALNRADRLRVEAAGADRRLRESLEMARAALVSMKGAEARLVADHRAMDSSRERQNLDEVLEMLTRGIGPASFAQVGSNKESLRSERAEAKAAP